MPHPSHPRRYRLTRRTPGVNWGSWTHTYHRTYGHAREAAARFFGGCEPYGYILRGSMVKTSEAILSERHDNGRGNVYYEPLKTWTDSHIQ